ncbi:MAG: SCP2 sterol-binding domain-containing protein [Deltaproteobacteria bacterium]|nr:SCP2 sterol-binding domain-containing protein [Deltaproteobacteria bacterium]MCL5277110.1 SCP2 sterol-binding domain-containing protein [Deltaproteobacteria bacterium]
MVTRETLVATLDTFVKKVNENITLKKILKGWSKLIVVKTKDPEAVASLKVERGTVVDVKLEDTQGADITLSANADVINDIFTGRANPSRLYLDGTLKVFASQKDQMVLDSIVDIVWK